MIPSQLARRWNDQGRQFSAATPGGTPQATTVALAQNYTGIGLVNSNVPGGSSGSVTLEVLVIGVAPTTTPAANSAVGVMGGTLAATDVPGTTGFGATGFTALTVRSATLGRASIQPLSSQQTAIGIPFSACNQLSTAPVLLESFFSLAQQTTSGGPAQLGGWVTTQGRWLLAPGGWICLYTSTALTGQWSIYWGEST